jgi:hypothetical protein
MRLYFGGAEVQGWRKLLAEQGVTDVSMSFVGLLRRTRLIRPWLVDEKFPEDQSIFLDSGGYSVNKDPEKYTIDDLHEIAQKYRDFLEANIDRIEMFSEFDSKTLGPDWLARERASVYEGYGDKFLPIWHGETGLAELERLAAVYGRVGVPQTSVGGRDIVPVLRRLARRGVKLHGVAMTKIELMAEIPWDSVASTSWLSPAQYGDSQIWTGMELKRYPKKYKQQGRQRHRAHLDRQGFDTALFEGDDSMEVLKVALWSWQQYVGHLNRHTGNAVTMSPESTTPRNSEIGPTPVGTGAEETPNHVTTAVVPVERERILMPGLELSTFTRSELGEDGEQIERSENLMGVTGNSLRRCDSCYIGEPGKCPAYQPGASCAYQIPLELKTREQYDAAERAMDAIRMQRILFAHMVEQAEGGYPDPNLSNLLKDWDKRMQQRREAESDTVKISATIRSRNEASTGMIGRLFGREASESARALPAPVSSDVVVEQAGIVDAEVLEP